MAKLSQQTIDHARVMRDALDAALRVAESGAIAPGELPDLPEVQITIEPKIAPTAQVAEAVAQAQEARHRFEAETQTRKAVSIVLGVAAEIGKMLLPMIGGLLLFVLALAAVPGCRPGIVQVGSTSKPAIEADVKAPIEIASPSARVGDVASPSGSIDARESTSQPATAVQGDAQAGRDARPVQVNLTASGSAWPIVACCALLMAGVAVLGWQRSHKQGTRMSNEFVRLRGNSLAVASGIAGMPPSVRRDDLLDAIGKVLPHRQEWDLLLDETGLRVRRKRHPVGCGSSGLAEPSDHLKPRDGGSPCR